MKDGKSREDFLKSTSSLLSRNNRQSTQIIKISSEPTKYELTLKNYTLEDSNKELSPSKSRLNNVVKYMSDLENQIPLASDLLTEDINSINSKTKFNIELIFIYGSCIFLFFDLKLFL